MMVFLGGVLLETFVNYANWFHDIPASLETANSFFRVRNPGHFFQTVFPLTLLTGIGFVIIGWSIKSARLFILASLVLLIGIEVLTIGYIYPRIGILLREGTSVHSVEELRRTAQEFLTAHQFRLAGIFIAEALSLIGLWKFIRWAALRAN
jgi:hypothetical protein